MKSFLIKVQTVSTIPVKVDPRSSKTLGQIVDEIIRDFEDSERIPNKLVIDLDPNTINPANVEST